MNLLGTSKSAIVQQQTIGQAEDATSGNVRIVINQAMRRRKVKICIPIIMQSYSIHHKLHLLKSVFKELIMVSLL